MWASTRKFRAFGVSEFERVLKTSLQVSIRGLAELGTITNIKTHLLVTVSHWYKKCFPNPSPRQTKMHFTVADWFWTGCKWNVGWGLIDSREGATGLLGRHTERKLSLAKLVPVYWKEKKKWKFFLNAENFWNFPNKNYYKLIKVFFIY